MKPHHFQRSHPVKSSRRRFLRRTVAIALGLFLGLLAAEVALDQRPTAAAYGSSPTSIETKPDERGPSHAVDALALQGGKGPWFGKLVRFTALLFFAAVVLGPVAIALKSPEPPEGEETHGHHPLALEGRSSR